MTAPRRPPELLDRPFTLQQAAAAGLTARQLQSGCWRRLFHNAYIAAELPQTLEVRAAAVSLVLPPDAVVGYRCAAYLHGADLLTRSDTRLTVIGQRGDQIRRAGVRATSALLEPGDVVTIAGIPVTSPTRTAFDLARQKDRIESVVCVDAMLNRGGCRLDDLTAYVAEHRRWRGVRYAERTVADAEPLAQSPMETRQRMHLVLAGLPRPRAQAPVEGPDGHAFAYIDNGYEEWRVGVDYDGDPHAETWRHDLLRAERIREMGWWHRRYSLLDVQAGWRTMVDHVTAALVSAGYRMPA